MQGLWEVPDAEAAALRASLRGEAAAWADRARLLARMHAQTPPGEREFLAGEVACLAHLSPLTAGNRLAEALLAVDLPPLLAALDAGRLTVPHAQALLSEVGALPEELRLPVARAVLAAAVLDEAGFDLRTPGELRGTLRREALRLDAEAARRRRERADRERTGARLRADADGLASLVVDGPAADLARAHAALRAQATLVAEPDLTQGQRELRALLAALQVEQTVTVQAVLECPVEPVPLPRAVVDVRMTLATALGLADEPAELAGYGPLDADAARTLLPAADLVRACVDSMSGEVLAVDPPRRRRSRTRRSPGELRRDPQDLRRSPGELRRDLLSLGLRACVVPVDPSTSGYVPTAAIGRLVDLRDVTSTFPGDPTPARRCDRDHRTAWPHGPTSARNVHALSRRWHRAKQNGWTPELQPDGGTLWTSPRGNRYRRLPRRTPPPPLPPGTRLPPLPEQH